MAYEQLNQEISRVIQSYGSLEELKVKYERELKKLDQFMDMFIERFGKSIEGDKNNSPEWKLYNTKCKQYNDYARAIRNIEYFIKKETMALT